MSGKGGVLVEKGHEIVKIAAKSVMTVTAIFMSLTLVTGCDLDGSTNQPGTDTAAANDTEYVGDDTITVLADAIQLGGAAGNAPETAVVDVAADASVEDYAVTDDATAQTDTYAPDVPVVYDVVTDIASDYGVDHDVGQAVRVPCPDGDINCPDGFYCADNNKGEPLCRPNGECSREGLVDLADVVREMMMSSGDSPIFVKVSTQVHMGPPSCTWIECDASNPCCNQCFASLMVGEKDFPIVLWGKDPEVSCMGNNCNLDKNCHPLMPEQEYVIWGTVQVIGGRAQFNLEGFCAVDEVPR